MFGNIKRLFINETIVSEKEKYSISSLQLFVEKNITNLMENSIDDLGMSIVELAKAKKRKNLFRKELNLCGLGDLASKNFLKSWISDLITQKYGVNENNIDYIINFDFPSSYDKFNIILLKYKQKYQFNALERLISDFNLDELKKVNDEFMFIISTNDINMIYQEKILYNNITFEDKLEILVQRIYEQTHGLSVIDEIRDQKIDGLSLGVSGVPVDFASKISDMNIKNKTEIKYPISYESIWLYFAGKEIYLEFLSFNSQRELERVCKKLFKFNNQKQFAKSDGFIFNNMADFSRIAVFRPPFAEGWAAFIRKFDIDGDLKLLIQGKNADFVSDLIKFMVRGKQKLCYTGQQGTGKTTMLVGALKELYPNVTLRVWESFFETFLRFKMPYRNILTLREIENLNGEKALDSLKKTNGQITVISEAAEDRVISYLVKSALTASESIMWTHHAERPSDLVQSHRNACINVGSFRDENIAEDQVLSILDFDIHLKKTANGKRFIERITEFIRLDEEKFNQGNNEKDFYQNAKMFFEKKTGAKKYDAINIVEYDLNTDTYIFKNKISEPRLKNIYNNLMEYDQKPFELFIKMLEKNISR